MNKYLYMACLVGILSLTASCKRNVLKGEGSQTTSSPSVAAFTAIEMELPVKINITMQDGAQPTVLLSGYENVIKHIKLTVDNGILRLKTDLDETWTIDSKDLSVTVTMPAITSLSLSGATDADVHGNIKGADFKLDISGASKVIVDTVNVDNFSTNISGAGDVQVKGGMVRKATYDLSGAGKILAFPLQSAETDATISGAGKSEITALQKLTANINGAGTIKYKGHPVVTQQVSGVGKISDAN